MLDGVQARLVGAMGELATMEEDLPKYDAKGYARITAEDVAWLEEQAHLLEKECDIRFKGWARPGKEGSLGSAYLDLARSVCRRAERRVVALRLDHALSNVNTALFLNRLSDLCWVLARFEALAAGEKGPGLSRPFPPVLLFRHVAYLRDSRVRRSLERMVLPQIHVQVAIPRNGSSLFSGEGFPVSPAAGWK